MGVLWHRWPYSNLFLSLIIVWSNVKPKPCFLSQFFSPLEHQLSALAVSAWPPRALVSDSLADIMTTRGQPAPQYHVLSQKHSGIDCFVLCLYKAVNYSCAPVSVRGCQSNTTPE